MSPDLTHILCSSVCSNTHISVFFLPATVQHVSPRFSALEITIPKSFHYHYISNINFIVSSSVKTVYPKSHIFFDFPLHSQRFHSKFPPFILFIRSIVLYQWLLNTFYPALYSTGLILQTIFGKTMEKMGVKCNVDVTVLIFVIIYNSQPQLVVPPSSLETMQLTHCSATYTTNLRSL